MKKETKKKTDSDAKKILQGFKDLNIKPESFPPYTDPVSFGSQFKQCSILRDVPLTTLNSCYGIETA